MDIQYIYIYITVRGKCIIQTSGQKCDIEMTDTKEGSIRDVLQIVDEQKKKA